MSRCSDGLAQVLWVGRLDEEKRLGLLLQVAERCPDIHFEIVGDGPQTAAVEQLKQWAAQLPNVHMHGYIPHAGVLHLYSGASALVCTSTNEGFPNTFLEAWGQCVPVVTTFDPDGIVARNQLGVYAPDIESLTKGIQAICSDHALCERLGRNAGEYYRRYHTVESASIAYDRLFRGLIGQQTSGAEPAKSRQINDPRKENSKR
jgi:glycosyltransferase involved in cell wall biosynthesis